MGLDYSYEFIAPRPAVDELLGGLAEELISEQRTVLRAALPWRPSQDIAGGRPEQGRGVAGLETTTIGRIKEYCLSLAVLADTAHMRAMRISSPGLRLPDGRLRYGCVWTQVEINQEWVGLQLTAATSGMSRDLVESTSLRQLGQRVARAGGAFFFLDDEATNSILLSIGDEFKRVNLPSGTLEDTGLMDSHVQEFAARAVRARTSFIGAPL